MTTVPEGHEAQVLPDPDFGFNKVTHSRKLGGGRCNLCFIKFSLYKTGSPDNFLFFNKKPSHFVKLFYKTTLLFVNTKFVYGIRSWIRYAYTVYLFCVDVPDLLSIT